MSASFADLTLWDVKFRVPRDRAAARVPDVEEEVAGRSGNVGEEADKALAGIDETLCDAPCRGEFCLRNCKAFASAFSCVRTKLASCYR